MRGRVLVAGGLLLALATIGYLVIEMVSGFWVRSEDTTVGTFTVAAVDVRADCGSVRVVAQPGATQVTVTRSSRWSWERGTTDAVVSGGTLVVRSDCAAWPPNLATAEDVLVTLPPSTAVTAQSSGGMQVEGLAGPLNVGTDQTAINFDTDGGLVAVGLTSTTVNVSAASGDVYLGFVAPPTSVTVGNSGGGIDVVVPKDDTSYRVEVSSGGSVLVRTDPDSRRTLTLESTGGDVVARYPS